MQSKAHLLSGKRVLIGVTGGIACYKTADLVSKLVQCNSVVHVIMTSAAARFVTPFTFESLSGNPVFDSNWKQIEGCEPQHIKLADQADAMIVVPCTMDMHAKLAHGIGDDPVSLVCSAIDRKVTPVILAPSMNTVMLSQPSTQRNISVNKEDGYTVLGTDEGWQACRANGEGRLIETNHLLQAIETALS